MPIALVAAVARGGVIGWQGRLPWRLPADLAYFKRLTLGHTVIMGRKTWQSIGRPLPGRRNVVLTRDADFSAPGCTVIHSPEAALQEDGELFVIGGQEVYAAFMPLAERLYVTRIDAVFPGDAWFPPMEEAQWRLEHSRAGTVDGANPYPHAFELYVRRTR